MEYIQSAYCPPSTRINRNGSEGLGEDTTAKSYSPSFLPKRHTVEVYTKYKKVHPSRLSRIPPGTLYFVFLVVNARCVGSDESVQTASTEDCRTDHH